MRESFVTVKNLKKYFKTPFGLLHAVDDVSFSIDAGETLGLVGESGCGKSTTGNVLMRLEDADSGYVGIDGQNILDASTRQMKLVRRTMQMIFQDPYSSINPKHTVASIIGEPLTIHRVCKSQNEYRERVLELMKTVGLAERLFDSYPHELDGGRRQRIGVARALALTPRFIICDEPVSALDVSIQAQIINLLQDLQEKMGLTFLFISHDLSVVRHISNRIAVMYLGQIVELAPSEALFTNPVHPYTIALLSAIPIPRAGAKKERIILRSELTSPIDPQPGCRFAPRCIHANEQCKGSDPALTEIKPGHFAACFKAH